MSTEQEPGQSLEQRGESLPAVPERAGAIVAEVITSIAEEANARAEEVRSSAEAEARARREAAHEDAGQIRTRLDDLAGKLAELRSGLREEEQLLSSGLRHLGAGDQIPALARPDEASEKASVVASTPEAAAAAAEPTAVSEAAEESDAETIADVELVEDQPSPDDDKADPSPSTKEQEPSETPRTVGAAPDETRQRLAGMNDRDLAFAYVDAVRASQDRVAAGMDPARADAVASAVIDEALTRPVFSDRDRQPGMGARIARMAARKRSTAIERLREATLGARDEGREPS